MHKVSTGTSWQPTWQKLKPGDYTTHCVKSRTNEDENLTKRSSKTNPPSKQLVRGLKGKANSNVTPSDPPDAPNKHHSNDTPSNTLNCSIQHRAQYLPDSHWLSWSPHVKGDRTSRQKSHGWSSSNPWHRKGHSLAYFSTSYANMCSPGCNKNSARVWLQVLTCLQKNKSPKSLSTAVIHNQSYINGILDIPGKWKWQQYIPVP